MKLIKKTMFIILTSLVLFGLFGCGKTEAPNTPADIEILFWESGYGREYLDKIIEAFEAKYPHYNVTLETTADGTFMSSKLGLGADYNTTDIMMGICDDAAILSKVDGEYPVLDLADIFNSKIDGESKTIAEKLGVSIMKTLQFPDGKYYSIPYVGGITGLAYNADVIDGSSFVLPRTTDELIRLANDLKADGKTPFIHFNEGGYWMYMVYAWACQYETQDVFYDRLVNPTLEKLTEKSSGLYKSLKVMENLIGNVSNNYQGSNTLAFTDAQTYFLNGKAVMMANGAWMENEMASNYKPGEKNYAMMKTPVISSIIEKCPSIENDAELAALVEAIDFGITALESTEYSVTQDDYDRVKEARSCLLNNAAGHGMVIPSYSNAIDAAKEFVKFYFSDEAIKIFEETTNSHSVASYSGNNLTDKSDFSDWANCIYELTETSTFVTDVSFLKSRHAIFEVGCTLEGGVDIIKAMSAANPGDRLTADGVWSKIETKHRKDWTKYWSDAGYSAPEGQ